jgi:hypothetical protein
MVQTLNGAEQKESGSDPLASNPRGGNPISATKPKTGDESAIGMFGQAAK